MESHFHKIKRYKKWSVDILSRAPQVEEARRGDLKDTLKRLRHLILVGLEQFIEKYKLFKQTMHTPPTS